MTQRLNETRTRVGAFETIAEADQAIRRLLHAGFSPEQLLVICPLRFREHFLPAAPRTDTPIADAEDVIVTGGIVGATLGGIALAATTALTGGGALVAAAVLIGGGAIAGGFGNLIVAKGYEDEVDAYYKEAIEEGRIVVGVELADGTDDQLAEAERILNEAGATALEPA